MSFRIWLDSIHCFNRQSFPDIRAEAVLSIEKTCLVAHAFEHIFWHFITLLKKWKEKSSDAACDILCEAYRQIPIFKKLYPPTNVSILLQCRHNYFLVKFENFVHSILRNKSSALVINISHFGVLCWQQWQPLASTTHVLLKHPKTDVTMQKFCAFYLYTCWQVSHMSEM